jgi:hypothetical protein
MNAVPLSGTGAGPRPDPTTFTRAATERRAAERPATESRETDDRTADRPGTDERTTGRPRTRPTPARQTTRQHTDDATTE